MDRDKKEWLDDMINGETWHIPNDEPSEDNEIEDWLDK